MRNLASVQKIKSLTPISGKDRILYADFENVGFRVIVESTTQVGDLVVYCEADTILPQKSEFEFLRSRCWTEKWNGFRIRNMKMAGLHSEGIVFPLSILGKEGLKVKEGQDVTEKIGAIKFDPELLEENKLQKKPKSWIMKLIYTTPWLKKILIPSRSAGGWPSYVSKTDETRAQSLNYIYEKYAGMEFYSSQKCDGQSFSTGMYKKKFFVLSRNINVTNQKDSRYWKTVEIFDLEKKIKCASKDLGIDLYIQGEQCGPGIQGNKDEFTGPRFFIFNIKDTTNDRYFSLLEMLNFCYKYDLEMVPLIETLTFNFKTMAELLEYSKGPSLFNPKVPREGVVLRPVIALPPDRGESNMCSFKVINPDFDLKYNK